MNLRELPPLALLPTFEAAGRLGSFKEAAQELHVTPSAVSQQMKALEESLGVVLFERRGRALVLTQDGAEFLRDVRQMLADLGSATRRLRPRSDRNLLRINTMDFVAYEFLFPRLPALRARFPGIELRIETSTRLVDFATSDVDAALRLGGGPLPGLAVVELGALHVAAVCSPALARSIRSDNDCFAHVLIELRGQEYRGWQALAAAQGLRKHVQFLTLETYYETVRAAEQGLGVAFGLFPLTTDWVSSGRLGVPSKTRFQLNGAAMWMVRKSDRRPWLTEIGVWLREEYQALPRLPEGRVICRGTSRARP
jgi:LysR family transcriptional regulator, glycine cleavage system transcriptional activator